ncbi:MAG: response regulator transcription factor [Dehalococcoidia bacterium]|nr:response regulator transcription factor [Dehalococcoidia bacterium]
MGNIRVLIADDHALVRDGTRQILEHEHDIEVVGEAADGEEALKLVEVLRPDVAIIDISMPRLDGIEATRRIKLVYPSVAVLIVSAYDDEQFIFSLLEAGAAGYLLKSIKGRELVEAVRAVYAGESVLHPHIARKVLDKLAAAPARGKKLESHEALSAREMDILRLVTKGLSNKDVAENLNLSMRTVQAHLGRIFNKLDVGSRTEAVVRALKEGWVTLDDVP